MRASLGLGAAAELYGLDPDEVTATGGYEPTMCSTADSTEPGVAEAGDMTVTSGVAGSPDPITR